MRDFVVSPRAARSAISGDPGGSGRATAGRMVIKKRAETEVAGRVAYVDPSKHWGYLYGPTGERVYFHAANVHGDIARLELGAEVWCRVADPADQLCAAETVRPAESGQ